MILAERRSETEAEAEEHEKEPLEKLRQDYEKGLDMIAHFQNDAGTNLIKQAAIAGLAEARDYLDKRKITYHDTKESTT